MKQVTALYRSPASAFHDYDGHVENQRRLTGIDEELERRGMFQENRDQTFAEADIHQIERIHRPEYVDWLANAAAAGGGWLDPDTYVCPGSFGAASLAAGAAITAVDAALNGTALRGFVLARPPGHHATPAGGMGFCLLNTIAIAAAHALDHGLDRVAIVDWDVHHGNGTQEAFYDSGEVLFCSVHQTPFYPGTGAASEQGNGAGAGLTVNVPLAAGQGDRAYVEVFDEVFLPALRAFGPELVLVSAGYDAHRTDPIGGMQVTEDGFSTMAARLAELAGEHAGGRIIAVLEGGYDPPALGRSVAATIQAFDGLV